MKYLKRIIKACLFIVGSILILTFLFTLLNYFDIIGIKTMTIIKIIIPLFSLALGGFILGKVATKNGWMEGLKIGLLITIIMLIFNLIFTNISLKDFIFYIALIISAILGSMIGINVKKEEKP